MNDLIEPLSPELALVDPDLAERARRALRAEPYEPHGARWQASAAVVRERAPVPSTRPDRRDSGASSPRAGRVVRLAAALAVPSLILNVALIRDATDQGHEAAVSRRVAADPASEAASSPARAPALEAAPRPGETAASFGTTVRSRASRAAPRAPSRPRAPTEPGTIRWAKDPRARLYDVVVWRDGRRVKDVWTRKHSVSVKTIACDGEMRGLEPGRYLWFVYPVYAPRSSTRHGSVSRWGSFDVMPETCAQRPRRFAR